MHSKNASLFFRSRKNTTNLPPPFQKRKRKDNRYIIVVIIMGKWRDEPMGAGGAAAAPYSRAANDECRICGGRFHPIHYL